ncbi:hypothetical protein SD71_06940 [Cohnella kolymensis]|uniref:Uncharacterized protein n=1 Tax=Cohnella kolymensis TaxID=1590652 RepID=A0ABR5A7R7_9BACL|nr:hypothetical protein [Cohnella kolymensis]KIL36723.1 hypothetical protein SD71_06940 [Cohnella kolymensis]
MRTKLFISIVMAGILAVGLFRIYDHKYSNEAILDNVVHQRGYSLVPIEKPFKFAVSLGLAWLLDEGMGERRPYNSEFMNIHNTSITLDDIYDRGNDLYFNFTAKPDMSYSKGTFLYPYQINEDGSVSEYNFDGIKVYDRNKQPIELGQRGSGPGSSFSFGIDVSERQRLKDGFTIEFSNLILYEYSRTQ